LGSVAQVLAVATAPSILASWLSAVIPRRHSSVASRMASVRSQPLRSIQRFIRRSLPCAREDAREVPLDFRSSRIGNWPQWLRSPLRQKMGNAGDAQQKQQARNDLSGIHGRYSACWPLSVSPASCVCIDG
jgi:hypothetical protein